MVNEAKHKTKTGKITQIVGVVVDIEFTTDTLPGIYNALTVTLDGKDLTLEAVSYTHLTILAVMYLAIAVNGANEHSDLTKDDDPETIEVIHGKTVNG